MKPLPLLAFAVAALFAETARAIPPEDSTRPILGAEGSRFVFGQISVMRADQYLLDTKTGRLWELVIDKDGNRMLRAIPMERASGSLGFIAEPDEEAAKFEITFERKPPSGAAQEHKTFDPDQYLKEQPAPATGKK